MTKTKVGALREIAFKMIEYADKLNHNDALGGGYGNAGSFLKRGAEYYLLGLDQVLPPEWNVKAKELKNESDPEYKEFLRLQEKFKV